MKIVSCFMNSIRLILVFILFLSFAAAASALTKDTIVVGRCSIETVITEEPSEHAQGLLGFTERTFPYGAMLFNLGGAGPKYFHTEGMQMTIRIMGVHRTSTGSYRVLGEVQKAPPGLKQIVINAPYVLEIPEGKYQLQYKKCLTGGQ